jgi:predicted nuclease of predicted toxin-antitoxin system
VRLLLDNNLSPRLVDLLTAPGWNVTHVRHLGLHRAPDHDVLQAARDSQRILVSADTDFGQLLARSRASGPSVVLVRRVIGRRVDDLAALLHDHLPDLEPDLARGSVVAFGDDHIRIRHLPLI